MKRGAITFLVALSLIPLCSCEPSTKAKVEGENPPVFSIWSGSGKFWMISIGEYRQDKSLKPSERFLELWRVDAESEGSAQYASAIGKVRYGVIPQGYRQSVPANGAPPPLVPGKYYSYYFASQNGMPARGDFQIRDGKAVSATIEYPCYYEEGGKEIEYPCSDSNANR